MATQFNNFYLASGGTLALAFGTSATKVYGSVDADTVTIAAGVTVVLDGSFNRGNDTIKFSGNADSYSIVRVNASTVRITDILGTSVTIPVGSAGTQLQFADATRTLSGSSGGILLGNQSVSATPLALTAGAAPTPVESYILTTSTPTVAEGNNGTKTLTYVLELNKAPTSEVSINYRTTDAGTAAAGDDFQIVAGLVTFAPGQTAATVSVTVFGDTVVEADETVVLQLSGSKLVSPVSATGTIRNDDAAPVEQTSFTVSAGDIAVANATSLPITVNVGETGNKTVAIQSDSVSAASGIIVNGNANTTITSGAKNDNITVSGNGNNVINTGAGDDTVRVFGAGNNTITGGAGSDDLNGGEGSDTITGGAGSDDLSGGGGSDTFIVGDGEFVSGETISGGLGTDTLVSSGVNNYAAGTLTSIENLDLSGTATFAGSQLANVDTIVGNGSAKLVVGSGSVDLSDTPISGLAELTVAAGAVVTLSAENLAGIASLVNNDGGAKIIVGAASYAAAIAKGASNANVSVVDTLENIQANLASLTGATSLIIGNVSVAGAQQLLDAGLPAAVTGYDLLDNASNLALAPVSIFNGATNLTVTGSATAAQAVSITTTILASNVERGTDYVAGSVTMNVADTPSNLANYAKLANNSSAFAFADSVTANGTATIKEAAAIYAAFNNASYNIVGTVADVINGNSATLGGNLAAFNQAASLTLSDEIVNLDDVVAINVALDGATGGLSAVVGGYALTASFASLTAAPDAAKTAAINAAASVAVTDAITVARALLINALGGVSKSYVVEAENYLAAMTANAQVVASASAIRISGANTLTAAEINALVAKYGTSKVADANITVQDTVPQLLTLSAGSVTEASAITVTEGSKASVNQLVGLRALTGAAKMPTVAVVEDTAENLATAVTVEATTALLASAKVTGITISDAASVVQVVNINAAYTSGKVANTYTLRDTPAALAAASVGANASAQTIAAVADAAKIDVNGAASVAQIATINSVALLDLGTTLTYTLSDAAGTLAGAAAVVDGATSVAITGAAQIAQVKTIAAAFTVTGNDAVIGTTLTYNITDNANAIGTEADLAFVNGAASVTLVDTIAELFSGVAGAADPALALADATVAKDSLASLVDATAAQKNAITRFEVNGTVVPTNATQVTQINALAAEKATVYNIAASTFAELTATTAGVATFVAKANSVTVSPAITPDQYNVLNDATAGGITAAITGTLAQLTAATAADAIANAAAGSQTVVMTGNTTATVAQAKALFDLGLTAIVNTLDIVDNAAAIEGAPASLLAAVDSITAPDGAVLSLSVAKALAVFDRANDGSIANNGNPDGSSRATYQLVDTAQNLAGADLDLIGFAASVSVTTAATVAQANSLRSLESMAGSVAFDVVDTNAAIFSVNNSLRDAAAINAAGSVRVVEDASASTLVTGNINLGRALALIAATNSGANVYGLSDSASILVTGLTVGSSVAKQAVAAAINGAAGDAVVTLGQVDGVGASALAALDKPVVYNITDTAANLALATTTDAALAEAKNISATGTATAPAAARLLAAGNSGSTSIAAVSATATDAKTLSLTANDTIAALAVTGTATIQDAVLISAKDTGDNIGSITFVKITGGFDAVVANDDVTAMATTVEVTGALTLAQAKEIYDLDQADGSTVYVYTVTGSFTELMDNSDVTGGVDYALVIAAASKVIVSDALTVAQAAKLDAVKDFAKVAGVSTVEYSIVDSDAAIAAAMTDNSEALLEAKSVTGYRGVSLNFEQISVNLYIVGSKATLDALSPALSDTKQLLDGVLVADLAANPNAFVSLPANIKYRLVDAPERLVEGNVQITPALQIIADRPATVAQANLLKALGAVYDVEDSAANVALGGAGVNGAVDISVTGSASFAQAKLIEALGNSGTTQYSISSTAAAFALADAGNIAAAITGASSIIVTGELSAANAQRLLTANVATLDVVAGTSADLAGLVVGATDSIAMLKPSNAANVAQAALMLARAGSVSYELTGTAAQITEATDAVLNAATKITVSGVVSLALAARLDAAPATAANTLYDLSDKAAAILAADPAALARGQGENNVITVTDTSVTAAVATQLRALDAANNPVSGTGGFVIQSTGAPGVYAIADSFTALTASANAAAVAAASTVTASGDAISVANAAALLAVRADAIFNVQDALTNLGVNIAATRAAVNVTIVGEISVGQAQYAKDQFGATELTYVIKDTVQNVVAINNAAVVAGATLVTLTTSLVSVAEAIALNNLDNLSGGFSLASAVTVADAVVVSELANLSGGYAIDDSASAVYSALNTRNAPNAADRETLLGAAAITLNTAASVDQVLGLINAVTDAGETRGLSTMSLSYRISDTAANLVAALTGPGSAAIIAATQVNLSDTAGISIATYTTLTSLLGAKFAGYDDPSTSVVVENQYFIADTAQNIILGNQTAVNGATTLTVTDTFENLITNNGLSNLKGLLGLVNINIEVTGTPINAAKVAQIDALNGTGTITGNIDTVAPTVVSIAVADSSLIIGETTTVTVTFSEAIASGSLALGDFASANGALSNLVVAGNGLSATMTLTPTASIADATNVVTLAGANFTDAAGNAGTGNGSSGNYAVDTVRPTVASITVADSSLIIGEGDDGYGDVLGGDCLWFAGAG
jgi:fibronectin-binding autotransporter adhesin